MRATAVLSLLVVLLAGGTAASQTPQAPPAPPPHPRPALRAHPANICTTQWGWCQLPTQSAAPGIACVCLTVKSQQVPGVTRFFPYVGPASPYLQPHTSPPTTIR
jgi:hypothetical protein